MPDDDAARRAAVAADLRRGVTRLGRRLRAEGPPGALSANKMSVLSHLRRDGPSTPGQIAAAERQQPQSLTRVFTELEREGLVSRSRSDRDGRESVLSLELAGLSALTRDMARRDAWLAGALEGLTAAEVGLLDVAAGLLDRLAATPWPG
jgi:DNA-binding MarR family transcriptional regulator